MKTLIENYRGFVIEHNSEKNLVGCWLPGDANHRSGLYYKYYHLGRVRSVEEAVSELKEDIDEYIHHFLAPWN